MNYVACIIFRRVKMNIKKIMFTTLVATGLSITAQASSLQAADDSLATNLCMTAASGNRAAMHNEIKASGKSAEFVAKNITCNGENILAFVENHGKNSQKILDMIDRTNKQVSITDLAQNRMEKN